MQIQMTERGFFVHLWPDYVTGELTRVVGESSAVGEYKDALEKPGSSYLWIGERHHLDRKEVKALRHLLGRWLRNGRLN
jgi:hypothetical protein